MLVLGFVILAVMWLASDVTGGYAAEPVKAAEHVVALAIAGLAIYIALAHFVERRATTELGTQGLGRQLGIGLLVGAGLYAACEGILMALRIYRITGLNPLDTMLPAVAMAVGSGVFEELLFRGVPFFSGERWFGTCAALGVTSLVFGLSHLANPQVTLEGALFIAVEAGVLLGAAVVLTRKLWLGIGFHVACNFTQEGVFSSIVSGNEPHAGWIRSAIQGPDYLTGGAFGVESSVLALVLCTTTGVVMLVMAHGRGRIVPPAWKGGA